MIKSMLNDLRANYDSVCYLMKYFHRVKGGTHYQIIQVLLTVIDAVLPVAYMILPGMIINELAQDCNLNKILIYVALLLILPRFMGIDGVMYAGPIADLVATIVCIILVVLEMRRPEFAKN